MKLSTDIDGLGGAHPLEHRRVGRDLENLLNAANRQLPVEHEIQPRLHRDVPPDNALEPLEFGGKREFGWREIGMVRPTRVVVPAGRHQITVTAFLDGTALAAAGVSRSTFEWNWERSDAENGSYVRFGTSRHRLYIVVREPVFPWTGRTGTPGEVIWTELLDWLAVESCESDQAVRGRPRASGDHVAEDSVRAVVLVLAVLAISVGVLGAVTLLAQRSPDGLWTIVQDEADFQPLGADALTVRPQSFRLFQLDADAFRTRLQNGE